MKKAYSVDNEFSLSIGAKEAIAVLRRHGYEAFLVGGAVRDFLLGMEPKDFDLATNATVEQIKKVFEERKIICQNGERHGTVSVRIVHATIEISTYRHETEEEISLENDLKHRDLTIDSLAYADKQVVDCVGGYEDLQRRILRFNNGKKTILEDPLRILRLLRMHAKLGFDIEEESGLLAIQNASLLKGVATERVDSEMKTILLSGDIRELLLRYKALFFAAFPSLSIMDCYEQNNPHHQHDLWTHTAYVVSNAKPELCLRMAALFHDIGKPESRIEKPNAEGVMIAHYYGHELVSARKAKEILKARHYDNLLTKLICLYIEHHDRRVAPTRKSVGKLLLCLRQGYPGDPYETMKGLFNLQDADASDHLGISESHHEECLAIAKKLKEERVPLDVDQLAISGNDLQGMGLAGEQIGIAKKKVLERVVFGMIPNERLAELDYVRILIKAKALENRAKPR